MKNFNKSFSKRILSGFMCVLFAVLTAVCPMPKVFAQESLDDMKKEYSKLEKSVAENEKKLKNVESDIKTNKQRLVTINEQIDSIKSQISLLDKQIDVLNSDIRELRPQITQLNGQIEDVKKTITKLDGEIEEAQDLAQDTQDALLARIREDYMAGGNASMVEVLLTSDDLSSFLARMELMDRVSENDKKLIDDLAQRAKELNGLKDEANHQKADLQVKKGVLDSKMTQLSSSQSQLSYSQTVAANKNAALNSKYAQVNKTISELDEDSEEYKAQIKRQRQEMNQLANQIDNYVEEKGSSKGDAIPEAVQVVRTSNHFIWPVPYNNTAISCHYGYYSDGTPHYGTDIVVRDANGKNISNGKNIVAAQSGTVIKVLNNGGYNGGYGNYCIIDHGDGFTTLYAHCRTVVVYEGQVVSQGQKIAEIGLTGNTTGYHVHFEVRVKNADGSVSRVNPEGYVSCPG